MAVRLHPDADQLVDYSSGGLSPALCVSVSAHLHFCETCRLHNDQLVEIGGVLLEDTTPEQMGECALEDVLTLIDKDTDQEVEPAKQDSSPELEQLPTMVRNLLPERGPKWRFLSPSLQVSKIPVGETRFELSLHKIKAGGKTPNHDHNGLEVTVVLTGSFSDDAGVYNEGDFIIRRPGDIHKPIASQDHECISLSVEEAPIRLVGPIARLLNPFFPFNPQ